MKATGMLRKYQGRTIQDDGAYKSQEFIRFARDFRSTVKDIASEIGGEICNFHIGHYDVSGFIQRSGKYVYFSYSEPRHMAVNLLAEDPRFGILIRTANNEKDYTGGYNNFCNILNMKGVAEKLLA